jgi:hypothetical protein
MNFRWMQRLSSIQLVLGDTMGGTNARRKGRRSRPCGSITPEPETWGLPAKVAQIGCY